MQSQLNLLNESLVQFAALTSNDSRNAFPNIIHSEVFKNFYNGRGYSFNACAFHPTFAESMGHSRSEFDHHLSEKCLHPLNSDANPSIHTAWPYLASHIAACF